jgi:hypothetical protein
VDFHRQLLKLVEAAAATVHLMVQRLLGAAVAAGLKKVV